ncbi:thiamine pyrophosphate-dependent enzyme [Paractinoplanes hotanensis]|uniref:Thiamine pyrophosphate-binding protein n=1 Tax=Paractinoplanes hotanensis TaxID=2906497 RepID=A0ABT0YAQ8_9ACTN|nr:thiamine pyrophosphate-dependent enzyme [Actinoplanes hotanensis]MCM4083123.1 thiamine pyrophosphate-binding protein [Actinoplanes hotanensis]
MTTAAGVLAATLAEHGVDRVFCVPGESFLDLLAELARRGVDIVTARHESGAAFMALADAKLTGRAGVVLVNRGPGATNAAIAVHSADLDATPLLMIVGDVRVASAGRGWFQELDAPAAFGAMSRRVLTLREPEAAGEFAARAWAAAHGPTPGPAVLCVPEDVLTGPGGAVRQPARRWPAVPAESFTDAVIGLLNSAQRPLVLAGSAVDNDPDGRAALRDAAHRHGLAVAVTNKRQDLYPNDDPHYAGHLHLATQAEQRDRLARADLVVAVGTRLDPVTTQGFRLPAAGQTVVQVHPDAAAIGTGCPTAHGCAASPARFLLDLARRPATGGPHRDRGWHDELVDWEAGQSRWSPVDADDGVAFGHVVAALPPECADAVVTLDAGSFTSWVHRYHRVTTGRLLGIASSAMGFGVPAAVAAALRRPDRAVIAMVGDGGFQMTGAELATAVQRGARLTVVVADNGSLGTIRQHQERGHPGLDLGTGLRNPDFAALARSHGALGLAVESPDEAEPALAKALACAGPALVHVRTSLRHISAYAHLDDLRRAP